MSDEVQFAGEHRDARIDALLREANAEVDRLLPEIAAVRARIEDGAAASDDSERLRELVHRLRNQVLILEMGGVKHGLDELITTLAA